jgi:uncharacterized protein
LSSPETRHLQVTDRLQPHTAWYREPWPWILMSGPAAAVAAGFVTLYIAVAGADPVVADNYYKEGLAINRVLERDRNALDRGYRAMVLIDRSRARVNLTGEEALPQRLWLRFTHPTQAGQDRELSLRQIQPGWYEAAIELSPAARWEVQLEDAERSWRLTGSWRPGEDGAFILAPAQAAN